MENTLACAGVTDHKGEKQVRCDNECCGATFWMTTNEIELAIHDNRAIFCPTCTQAAIKAVSNPFREGPD